MSGRANRIKYALSSTLANIKSQYDQHPNIYIAGFYNGLSFAEHHINMRSGDPAKIDISSFPVKNAPMSRPAPEPLDLDDQEYESLVDKILTSARELTMPPESNLGLALKELDAFIDAKLNPAPSPASESANTVPDPL